MINALIASTHRFKGYFFSAAILILPLSSAQAASPTVKELEQRVSALEAQVASLQTKLASVSTETVNGHPTVRFTGVNVQVVNGLGSTASANGTGNLIVGYDELDPSGLYHCTFGTTPTDQPILDQATCTTAGGIWTNAGFKIGSHYFVGGIGNNYARWGGMILGYQNTVNFDYATVLGGYHNTASGVYSSVSGGGANTAAYGAAAVSGGLTNTASGFGSSVTGGQGNKASAQGSSVSGGQANVASGFNSNVSGGNSNTASGSYANVSGGGGGDATTAGGNVASGNFSSILGGVGQHATGTSQTIPAIP